MAGAAPASDTAATTSETRYLRMASPSVACAEASRAPPADGTSVHAGRRYRSGMSAETPLQGLPMATVHAGRDRLVRRAQLLARFGLAWHLVEAAVAIA